MLSLATFASNSSNSVSTGRAGLLVGPTRYGNAIMGAADTIIGLFGLSREIGQRYNAALTMPFRQSESYKDYSIKAAPIVWAPARGQLHVP